MIDIFQWYSFSSWYSFLQTNTRLTQISELSRELKAKLVAKESELDSSTEELRSLRQEHVTTRSDAEGMLRVMSTLESQLTEYATREESTMSIAREAKEKVEQAMLERDQAVVSCCC